MEEASLIDGREGYASCAALQGTVRYRPLALYEAALLPAKAIGLGHLSLRLVARRRPGCRATHGKPVPAEIRQLEIGSRLLDQGELL